jgi:hypothetical protein
MKKNKKLKIKIQNGSLSNMIVGFGISSIVGLGVLMQTKGLFSAKQEIGMMQEIENLKQVLPKRLDCRLTMNDCLYDSSGKPSNPRVNLKTSKNTVLVASMEEFGQSNANQQPGIHLSYSTIVAECKSDGVQVKYRKKIKGNSSTAPVFFNLTETPVCSFKEYSKSSAQQNSDQDQFYEQRINVTVDKSSKERGSKVLEFYSYRSKMAVTLSGVLRTKDDNAKCEIYAWVQESKSGKVLWGSAGTTRTPIAALASHDNGQTTRLGFSRRMAFDVKPGTNVKLFIIQTNNSKNKGDIRNCWYGSPEAIMVDAEYFD